MFIRFPSITNSYNTKYLQKWRQIFPQVDNLQYALVEKIHGTNLQIIFDRTKYNDLVVLASRSHVLKPKEYHYGAQDVFGAAKYQTLAQLIQDGAENNIVNVYAELFGNKIMKGVMYGEKQIRIFAISINGIFLSYHSLIIFMKTLGLDPAEYLAPLIKVTNSLQEALDFKIDNISSRFTPTKDEETEFYPRNPQNLIEGVVITPYEDVVEWHNQIFIIKRKNEWATEKLRVKKPKVTMCKAAVRLREEFESYITIARMEAAFSKYGRRIESPKEFQIFIPMILQDAKEEFDDTWKEQLELLELDQAERKFLYNVGGKIAGLLNADLLEK